MEKKKRKKRKKTAKLMKFYVTGKIIERGILWNSFHSYIVYLLKNVFGGSGVLSPKTYVDVPAEPQKSDLLYTIFSPNNPSSVYHLQ